MISSLSSPNSLFNTPPFRDRLSNCPQVKSGDFDLDGLCSDLRKKAKCTGSGPMVNQDDFHKVMMAHLNKGEAGKKPDPPTDSTICTTGSTA